MSETEFIEAAGQKLEVRRIEAAVPGGPTLVFLHEGLGCAAMWHDFPDKLCAATGRAGLIYSRRGYGASGAVSPLPRPFRFMHDEAFTVLPAVMDAAELSRVILVGHSDGASIALLHAAQRKSRVRGVAVLAPHVFVEERTVQSIARIGEEFRTTDLRARLARYHGENVDGAFWGWNGVWLNPAFRAWNIENDLVRIQAPLCAIQGDSDEYGTQAQIEAIQKYVRAPVETHMLAGCGHSPQRDQPEATLSALTAFVKKVG